MGDYCMCTGPLLRDRDRHKLCGKPLRPRYDTDDTAAREAWAKLLPGWRVIPPCPRLKIEWTAAICDDSVSETYIYAPTFCEVICKAALHVLNESEAEDAH